jgi:hypothetical protein
MEESSRKKRIVFYPSKIIEYAKKKGFITSRDLQRDFGYKEKTEAIIILSYLRQLSILTSEEDDYEVVEEERRLVRKYKLTDKGLEARQYKEPITIELEEFPIFARFSIELLNEMLEVGRARGMGFEELIEMAMSNPTKFREIVNGRRVAILAEYGPEDLRELAKEIKDFFPRDYKR